MSLQIGDIVDAKSNRWVVSGFSERGGIEYVALIRRYGSIYQHYSQHVENLMPVERPVFQPGEAVTVDGIRATFMSRDGIRARVMLSPQRWEIAEHELMEVRPAVAVLSYVTLVLENRWTERPNKEVESWQ